MEIGDEDAEGEGGSDSGDDVDLAALDLAFHLYDDQLTLLFISCTSFHLLLYTSPPTAADTISPSPLSPTSHPVAIAWPMGQPIRQFRPLANGSTHWCTGRPIGLQIHLAYRSEHIHQFVG